MEFETVIGIEIHCELSTKSKMFSCGPNLFNCKPNTNVNIVDMAFPGTMPRLNKKAVEYALLACKALNLTVDPYLQFDRKNYFYSDLPKGFQITQDKHPIGRNGYLDIVIDGKNKRIGIERLHMEEDTAKQLHYPDFTLLDYNRCGVPLVEIVSKPEIRSGKEAAAYVDTLRTTLLYAGISDCKMEEGSLRCDVNVSINEIGAKEFGTKTEIKNLNSISNIMRAVDFEVERQKQIILSGGKVIQETRRFDETTKQTVLMRVKNDSVDYKYFTEPNIYPITLDQKYIEEVQSTLKEMPSQRRDRYLNNLGLSEYDTNILIQNKELSDYFEEGLTKTKDAKTLCNWIISSVLALLNKDDIKLRDLKFSSYQLGDLINMINEKSVSSKQAKEIFEKMVENGNDPKVIAKELNMVQVSDTTSIDAWVNEVLNENPQAIEQYKSGKTNVLGFLVGQVLKKSKGQANPGLVNKVLIESINKH